MWLKCITRISNHQLLTAMLTIPSSRINNLLSLTIALARANIWRWPTDRLDPPLEIWLSKVSRFSSSSDCNEDSPDARRAAFSAASSICSNGSKFLLRVPLMSSGFMYGVLVDMKTCGRGLTICGMIVILERRISRLIVLVLTPSKYTSPSTTMHRRRESIKELWIQLRWVQCMHMLLTHLSAPSSTHWISNQPYSDDLTQLK